MQFVNGNRRECRVCSRPVTGYGPSLRHLDEAVAFEPPDPRDAATYDRALRAGEAALREMPAGATAGEVVLLVVDAVYRDGLLRRQRAPLTDRR